MPYTVDERIPAPVDSWFIPLFSGFQSSFWWCRISFIRITPDMVISSSEAPIQWAIYQMTYEMPHPWGNLRTSINPSNFWCEQIRHIYSNHVVTIFGSRLSGLPPTLRWPRHVAPGPEWPRHRRRLGGFHVSTAAGRRALDHHQLRAAVPRPRGRSGWSTGQGAKCESALHRHTGEW